MQKQIGGKPVVVDDSMIISSTDTILYGQPKAYHYNLGQAPMIDKDLSVGFRSNSAVYRGVLQADGKLDDAAAFVKYTRAT
jgi:HK97 family phage major capsid protein